MNDFPTATPLNCFKIDGKLYERVTQSEGTQRPDAIRARVKDKVAFFVPFKVAKSNEELAA